MTTTTHFTAWLTNDPSCLDQPCIDLTVLEDEPIDDADGKIEWVTDSSKDPEFYAVTTVEATADDIDDAFKQAEQLLDDAGWRIVGHWDVNTTSYTVTVERTAA